MTLQESPQLGETYIVDGTSVTATPDPTHWPTGERNPATGELRYGMQFSNRDNPSFGTMRYWRTTLSLKQRELRGLEPVLEMTDQEILNATYDAFQDAMNATPGPGAARDAAEAIPRKWLSDRIEALEDRCLQLEQRCANHQARIASQQRAIQALGNRNNSDYPLASTGPSVARPNIVKMSDGGTYNWASVAAQFAGYLSTAMLPADAVMPSDEITARIDSFRYEQS